MPIYLKHRDRNATERMDDPDCDVDELKNTYRQFSVVNKLICRWKKIYKSEIRPLMKRNGSNTLLDIGFGGGDIPINMVRWAENDGFDLEITAIDHDPRAYDFVQNLNTPDNIEFMQCRLSDLDARKRQYDFIISNHLLHHLDSDELIELLHLSESLSTKKVVFNDIHRNDIAYLLFRLITPLVFNSSLIREDGLTSIRRSYTATELSGMVPEGWSADSLFPFRLLLSYSHE